MNSYTLKIELIKNKINIAIYIKKPRLLNQSFELSIIEFKIVKTRLDRSLLFAKIRYNKELKLEFRRVRNYIKRKIYNNYIYNFYILLDRKAKY